MGVVEGALAAGGAVAVACLTWIIGGAVRASITTTAAAGRDKRLLDELFDGTHKRVTHRVGAGRSGGPTPAVLIAGAIDRGYRFIQATRGEGRTTMEFHQTQGPSSDA